MRRVCGWGSSIGLEVLASHVSFSVTAHFVVPQFHTSYDIRTCERGEERYPDIDGERMDETETFGIKPYHAKPSHSLTTKTNSMLFFCCL